MTMVAPSLLAADFSRLETEIHRIEKAGADWLHLDVMDGAFVPNISFGAPVIKALRPRTSLFFDVHLMIQDPMRYVENFAMAGADLITVHVESTEDPSAVLARIRSLGLKCGISLSPATPVEAVLPYLHAVDLVLVMTVVPGFGGQALIPETLPKLTQLRTVADAMGHSLLLEADGGIYSENAACVRAAGADVLVAGSAVFRAKDPQAVISALRGC